MRRPLAGRVPHARQSAVRPAAVQVGTGPAATRLIVDCLSVEVKGDRLSGQMEGRTTGDWILIGPEGTGTLDVRIQAVGKGTINEDLSVDYEWYEIR